MKQKKISIHEGYIIKTKKFILDKLMHIDKARNKIIEFDESIKRNEKDLLNLKSIEIELSKQEQESFKNIEIVTNKIILLEIQCKTKIDELDKLENLLNGKRENNNFKKEFEENFLTYVLNDFPIYNQQNNINYQFDEKEDSYLDDTSWDLEFESDYDDEKYDSPEDLIQNETFDINEYEKFVLIKIPNNKIADIVKVKLKDLEIDNKYQILNFINDRDIFYPEIFKNLPSQDWIIESLILDISDEARNNNLIFEIEKFYNLITKLKEKYEPEEVQGILYFLKNKSAFKKLSFIDICNIIDFLNYKSTNSLQIIFNNSPNWHTELIFDLISDNLNFDDLSKLTLISEYIKKLNWDAKLTLEFIKPINKKQDLDEAIKFLKLCTSKYVNEIHIRSALENKNTINNESLIKRWQHSIEEIIIKDILDDIIKFENSHLVKSKIARLIHKNTSLEYILNFLKHLSDKNIEINLNILANCLDIIYEFDLNHKQTLKAFEIILTKDQNRWTKQIHDIAIKATFKSSHKRNLDELMDYLIKENPDNQFIKNDLKSLYKKIKNKSKGYSDILKNNKIIKQWNEEDINKWIKESVEMIPEKESGHFRILKNEEIKYKRGKTKAPLIEIIAVIKRAVKLGHGYNPRTIQILSLLILLNKQNNKKCLTQINTGEGKSCIIAMLAALKCLETGRPIDISTTSTELSKSELTKQKKFFQILGLTNSENSTRNESKKRENYKKDIVYGKVSDFMGDKLRERSENKNILNNRNSILIVDEVDSMFIDGRDSRVELSSPMPGMQHLEIVLASIWSHINNLCTHFVGKNGQFYYCTEAVNHNKESGDIFISGGENINEDSLYKIDDWQKFIKENTITHVKKLLGNYSNYPSINIPDYLKKYANDQIEDWVKNAIIAKFYHQKERGYDVDYNKNKIIPIDHENTGELQRNTVWSDGLEQFLQLKEKLRITWENMSTDIISNIKFFNSYGYDLYGLTGTLGSQSSKEFLAKKYNTDFITIPPFSTIEITNNEKSMFISKELPPIIANNAEDWFNEIAKNSIREAKCKRGVLILCKYIKDVKKIAEYIKQNYDSPEKVHIYTGQKDFGKDTIAAGEIIVATSIAGRGTDITPSKYVNENGGLYVILTDIPKNSRVEKQNGGRTGRQGKPGSIQHIIINKKNQTLDEIRKERDEKEKEEIKKALISSKKTELKDYLFERYCSLKNSICSGSKDTTSHKDAIKERYGVFINDIQKKLNKIENFNEKEYDNIINKFEEFEKDLRSSDNYDQLIKNPAYNIKLGNSKMVGKINKIPFDKVISEYDKAISLDSKRALYAHYNKAYALILKSGKKRSQREARRELIKAKDLIKEEYFPQLLSFNTLVNQNGPNRVATQQIQHHMNILGQIETYIDRAIGFIDNALSNDWEVDVETESLKEIFEGTETDHTKEIQEVNSNGLWELFTLKKRPPPTSWWSIFAVGLLGLGQVILGAAITVFSVGTGSQIGLGLISEGVSDIIAAIKGAIKGGEFSWKEWSIQKAVSLAISIISAGIGAVKDALKATKEAVKNTVSAIKTGVTELTKEGWKVAAKQVGMAIGKSVGKEVITSLADYAIEQTVLKDIEREIETIVSNKIYEALQNNNSIKEAINLNLINKNNKWQNLFIKTGLDLLKDKQRNRWLTSISQIAQGVAAAKVPGLSAAIQATKMTKALSNLTSFTNNFISAFDNKINQYQNSIKAQTELQSEIQKNSQNQDNEEKQLTPQFYKPSKISRVHNIFTENITCKMTDKIQNNLISPMTSSLSNMTVESISAKATKTINTEFQNYRFKRTIKVSQDKIAESKDKVFKSKKNDIEIDPMTSNFVLDTLEDGKGSILHLGAFSKEFDCPIEVYNKEGKLAFIVGENNPGKPIKLEYQKPNDNNKNGHWNPLGSKIESKDNNCLYDSIAYIKNKKAEELRQIAGDCIIDNIEKYQNNIPAIERLQMTGDGSLYAGGGALSYSANKLMLLEQRYDEFIQKHPNAIKYLKNSKYAYNLSKLLTKATPVSFGIGLIIDYATEQLYKSLSNTNLQDKITNFLIKADKDLTPKQSKYLTNKIIQIARAGGRSAVNLSFNKSLKIFTNNIKSDKLKNTKTKQSKHKWHPRIEKRINEAPITHDFPVSFDKFILKTRPRKLLNGRLGYTLKGNRNGKPKVYNIIVDKNDNIVHRDFIPPKFWKRRSEKWGWPITLDEIEGNY
ncbi:MAG: hypothetical protein GY830_07060 [Bacteroidetes bacterium]|nr:hypothetical protein [Bacteroidota bacterium]